MRGGKWKGGIREGLLGRRETLRERKGSGNEEKGEKLTEHEVIQRQQGSESVKEMFN